MDKSLGMNKSKHPSGIRPRGVSTYYLMKLSSFFEWWGRCSLLHVRITKRLTEV